MTSSPHGGTPRFHRIASPARVVAARFRRDQRGSIALVLGLALPLLLGVIAAATEYAHLALVRADLQKAADSAAMAAAKELALANADDTRIASVATSLVLSGIHNPSAARVSSQILSDRTGVRVSVAQGIESWMGKLVTLPTSELAASATAVLSGSTRICVVNLDPTSSGTLQMDKTATLTADQCSVYSNSKDPKGIIAKDGATLKAGRICSGGGYDGKSGTNFSPAPMTDCPQREDPLANRPPPSTGLLCMPINTYKGGVWLLLPGRYCGGLRITGGAKVTLGQGTYVIDGGPLVVDQGSSLSGDYVGFYFAGPDATFTFAPDSSISLSAPKTGDMAGILFFEDRTAPLLRKFNINSDNARNLLGTIYLSRGQLCIDANKPIADESAYTVIVSRQLRLSDGPNLVLNSMYSKTDVPVPDGVGPVGAKINLTQ